MVRGLAGLGEIIGESYRYTKQYQQVYLHVYFFNVYRFRHGMRVSRQRVVISAEYVQHTVRTDVSIGDVELR